MLTHHRSTNATSTANPKYVNLQTVCEQRHSSVISEYHGHGGVRSAGSLMPEPDSEFQPTGLRIFRDCCSMLREHAKSSARAFQGFISLGKIGLGGKEVN